MSFRSRKVKNRYLEIDYFRIDKTDIEEIKLGSELAFRLPSALFSVPFSLFPPPSPSTPIPSSLSSLPLSPHLHVFLSRRNRDAGLTAQFSIGSAVSILRHLLSRFKIRFYYDFTKTAV